MARKRLLDPGFFRNEALGECSPLARLLFAGLWCWADREGRVEDRPKRLRAEILPYDQVEGEQLVAELERHGLVVRYEAEGRRVLEVVNFSKHQDPHPNETPSKLPPRLGSSIGAPLVNQRGTKGAPSESQGVTLVAPCHASPSCPSSTSGTTTGAPPAHAREAGAADRVEVLHSRDQVLSQKYPRTAELLSALEQAKCPAAWPKEPETRAAVEAAIGEQAMPALLDRVCAAIAESAKPWLGHHLPAIRGVTRPPARAPPGQRPRGMAAPSTDFTSDAATKF